MKTALPAIIGACAALAVACLGLIGALIGARLQKAREQQHWLRDQQLRNAVEFITPLRRLLNEYRRYGEAGMDQAERQDLRERMRTARSALELLCSEDVVAAVREVNQHLYVTGPDETATQRDLTEHAFHATVDALSGAVKTSLTAPDNRCRSRLAKL